MFENRWLIILRSFSRKIGITKLFIFTKKGYEIQFGTKMLSYIKENDIIYDIGANCGYYTKQFLLKSSNGKVFAFEPIPELCEILKNFKTNNNLFVNQIAVGSHKGNISINVGNDALNATSSIYNKSGDLKLEIEVERLDDIVMKNNSIPNVLKIDVEGYELEVLKGMPILLKNEKVCVIAMEIHFNILRQNGFLKAPTTIVKLLKQNNFKVSWIDASHLIATRGRP